jgi:hypothetical protein
MYERWIKRSGMFLQQSRHFNVLKKSSHFNVFEKTRASTLTNTPKIQEANYY